MTVLFKTIDRKIVENHTLAKDAIQARRRPSIYTNQARYYARGKCESKIDQVKIGYSIVATLSMRIVPKIGQSLVASIDEFDNVIDYTVPDRETFNLHVIDMIKQFWLSSENSLKLQAQKAIKSIENKKSVISESDGSWVVAQFFNDESKIVVSGAQPIVSDMVTADALIDLACQAGVMTGFLSDRGNQFVFSQDGIGAVAKTDYGAVLVLNKNGSADAIQDFMKGKVEYFPGTTKGKERPSVKQRADVAKSFIGRMHDEQWHIPRVKTRSEEGAEQIFHHFSRLYGAIIDKPFEIEPGVMYCKSRKYQLFVINGDAFCVKSDVDESQFIKDVREHMAIHSDKPVLTVSNKDGWRNVYLSDMYETRKGLTMQQAQKRINMILGIDKRLRISRTDEKTAIPWFGGYSLVVEDGTVHVFKQPTEKTREMLDKGLI